MRIAQVSPLYESVPPKLYGGTERVVSYLTEELVKLGHDVTLYASGDSETSARLVPIYQKGLRLSDNIIDPLAHHILMLGRVMQDAHKYDIIHFHIDYIHFPLIRCLDVPTITTLHGRLDIPDIAPLYKEFNDIPVVSISNDQRNPLPYANWVGTVYHGLPIDLYKPIYKKGDYLAFLGRISPEKRPDLAIEIAIKADIPLKIAAKVDKADYQYYMERIKPLLKHPLVEFVGEITEKEKNEFLGNAMALLFPIDWPEPFGLVMIEAMACATPVIARKRGSVPEVMEDGVTGFVFEDIEEAVACIRAIDRIDRSEVRKVFEKRFTSRRMAFDYLRIYNKEIGKIRLAA
ncbi:MAG: glycosyltransferase family 4 protein [Nitrospirae bacterium]|nr:glycosyltransferase family 4 protein [Nitrospirota bacterium]